MTGLWFLLPAESAAGTTIYGAYAAACGWRLCLDTWSRTEHSAVYAVSRVQRPFYSLVLVDFIEVFGLLWAWLRIGPIALAIVLGVGGTLRCIFTLYYAARTRKKLLLPRRSRSVWRELVRGGWPSLPWLESLKFAGLNASLQVESMVILLLGSGVGGEGAALLAMTIHSFSPLLGAGSSWAQIFYFDFKRIEAMGERFFARRMGRVLDRVALAYPPLLVALVLPVAYLLAPELIPDAPVAVALFVVARSLFSIRQLEAFCYVDHRVQLRQALILALGLGGVALLPPPSPGFLYAVVAVFVVAAVAGPRARLSRHDARVGQVLGLEAWLEWLGNSTEPLRLVTMVVDRSTATLAAVQRAMLEGGHRSPFVRVGHARWVTLVETDSSELVLRARLIAASGGTLSSLTLGCPIDRSNMRACLRESQLLSTPMLESARDVDVSHEGDSALRLEREFLGLFPQGRCLSERAGSLARWVRREDLAISGILHDTLTQAPNEHSRDSDYAVITYRPHGEISRVFVTPVDPKDRAAFRQFAKRVRGVAAEETLLQHRSNAGVKRQRTPEIRSA